MLWVNYSYDYRLSNENGVYVDTQLRMNGREAIVTNNYEFCYQQLHISSAADHLYEHNLGRDCLSLLLGYQRAVMDWPS